ncbi:MAG: hypothetical protein U1E45_00430 [Geminicoccaceae bacterium]
MKIRLSLAALLLASAVAHPAAAGSYDHCVGAYQGIFPVKARPNNLSPYLKIRIRDEQVPAQVLQLGRCYKLHATTSYLSLTEKRPDAAVVTSLPLASLDYVYDAAASTSGANQASTVWHAAPSGGPTVQFDFRILDATSTLPLADPVTIPFTPQVVLRISGWPYQSPLNQLVLHVEQQTEGPAGSTATGFDVAFPPAASSIVFD